MRDYLAHEVRNVAVLGHSGAGKTAVLESILFFTKASDRFGHTSEGSSLIDYDPEEIRRGISVYTSIVPIEWKECKINFLDTPGYADFCGEKEAAIATADNALIIVGAKEGVQSGTIRAWEEAQKRKLPTIFFINKTDEENASFDAAYAKLREVFGKSVIPFEVPIIENDELCPVFSGSANLTVGIERLMDLIIKYFPAYGEAGSFIAFDQEKNDAIMLETNEKEALSVQVFKTIVDPFVGRISYLKVMSGVLSSDTAVYNTQKDKTEKISQIFIVKGKHQTAVGKLFTGDIGAVVKLQATQTNDTLCEKGNHYAIEPIPFSEPMLGMAVYPKSKNDEDKMSNALARICEEDATLRLENNKETKQTVLYGVGDQHLEVALNKLKARYKVEVELKTPRVPYRETIRAKIVGEGRHKKQTGGHGQFGHVFIEFEPNEEAVEMVFEEKVFGGAIPKGYFPAVETGLKECMEKGVLAGYKVVNIKATLLDGKYHDVDSSEMAFKLAAHLAYKDAMPKAKPVLLEPIVNVHVRVPDEYTGDIIGDFNKRRGAIIGMDMADGYQIINAQVPLAEMQKYPIELRAMTKGRGSYTQVFERYDQVPQNLSERIITQAKAAAEEK